MNHLRVLHKYFLRYRRRLLLGLLFVTISNLFAVVQPVVVRNVIDSVVQNIETYSFLKTTALAPDFRSMVFQFVLWNGLLLLGLALMRGLFMFLMRQTIIVMSRHIEYDQKNEIFAHYQQLHLQFFKTHFTGDLMNRISEDVSRVRMYTGPAVMYTTNLVVLIIMCIWGMLRVDAWLTLFVVLPFPLLALAIFYVNKIIYKKSEQIQSQLSGLTSAAQESYSGIRVIKSFVQEHNIIRYFNRNSEDYKQSAIGLSLTEAIYFPGMNFFIGLSLLSTVLIGGYLAIKGSATAGNIAEFVLYINMLMFPISSIGWVASMVQRAGASQKRINEFLDTRSEITSKQLAAGHLQLHGEVKFDKVTFKYPHTGIIALKDFSLTINAGEKIALVGKTGSGKSTLSHLLLRMYDTTEGDILLDGKNIKDYNLQDLRKQIAYAPQDNYLFSDTVFNNIKFGKQDATEAEVKHAAQMADLEKDILQMQKGYETMVGERGVMLSGGQKQRIVLARALLKNSPLLILDECLSAVDTQTEQTILKNLNSYLTGKSLIVITHRLFTGWQFDKILVLENGSVSEQGTHEELMLRKGQYAYLYHHQTASR